MTDRMLRHRTALYLALAALAGGRAEAQDTTATARDSVARRLAQLERQVDSLRRVASRQEERLMELDERTAGGAQPPRAAADTGRRTLVSTRGVYGKPFVRRFGAGTAVGGYVDVEYRHSLDRDASAFDQHRLVPFIFSEITDRLHFGTEIEFEHGPRLEIEDGGAEGNGEVNVEFATLDYRIAESLNLRGGIVLSPLGRFNLVHDSPVNDLTDRPLVDQVIIPTTLSEAGLGFFGTIYPSARSLLSYELYVVNGFTEELVEADEVADAGRLNVREARGLRGGVANAAKNVVGRLAFSPLLGVEIGASAHAGELDAGDEAEGGDEDGRATIWAIDATVQRGALELLGEYARLRADLAEPVRALGVSDTHTGYYLQANYHFGHGWLAPRPTSVFTGVARWDHVDFAPHARGGTRQRLTLGLNWRPVEDAALKTDVQWDWATPRGTGGRGALERRVVLSLATYF